MFLLLIQDLNYCLLFQEIDWFECAKRTYDKKFDSEITDIKDYARRVRFLAYKGFETEHVKAVIGEWNNQ